MNSSIQARLAAAFSELQKLYPDWRFGQLIANVATWARGPSETAVWEATDEELLQAAEEHLHRNAIPSGK